MKTPLQFRSRAHTLRLRYITSGLRACLSAFVLFECIQSPAHIYLHSLHHFDDRRTTTLGRIPFNPLTHSTTNMRRTYLRPCRMILRKARNASSGSRTCILITIQSAALRACLPAFAMHFNSANQHSSNNNSTRHSRAHVYVSHFD